VVERDAEACPRAAFPERLQQARAVATVEEARIDLGVEYGMAAHGRDSRRLVQDRELDRVAAERSGVDERVAVRPELLVQGRNQAGSGAGRIIFDLDEAEDIGV
jgi:hypothetical protein